ncbi:MAG: phosphate transport system regulatory protein PhoU [Gemmatimonadetes bacterium]|nr:phosphate transport system regulatory protein PhoU [Gemmatimonadota bacterium]
MVVMLERKFDQQLDDLKTELLAMGGAVEKSVEQALYALVERDDQTVNDVLKGGVEIDEWEIQVEEQTLTLLATHAPVAKDLRLLTTVLKINDDLERINDQSVNIAQRAAVLNKMPLLKPLIDIPGMADIARGMVRDALDAFVRNDVNLARIVGEKDEKLDDFRDRIFRELVVFMTDSKDQVDVVDRAIQLILISRHLERIGDHASNIAENVVYAVEGRIVRHKKEKWWME